MDVKKMIRIIELNYGADADGNRGICMEFYELESSDVHEIERQIGEAIEDGNDSDTIVVQIECQETGDMIDFDIDVKDFV